MDQLHTRLDALEQHMHAVTRRLRWWRGLACGLVGLAVLAWALPVVTADDTKKSLEQRVAALETLLKHFRRDGNEVFIEGANLHLVNGLGSTTTTNGLGNLIVGYNEPLGDDLDVRTGSHTVVIGRFNNFSGFAGIVAGQQHEVSGDFASVLGGIGNRASGVLSVTVGGQGARAVGGLTTITGGNNLRALAEASLLTGGHNNEVDVDASGGAIFGGESNLITGRGRGAVILGGFQNTATEIQATVSGGQRNLASGLQSSVMGGEDNEARGALSTVSGGENNVASGVESSVSGGKDVTQDAEHGWAAGSFGDEVTGSFRSP